MLFKKIVEHNNLPADTEKLGKTHVQNYWQKHDFHRKTDAKRTFLTIKSENSEVLVADDLKPLFVSLLETHPGLEFLKATPEF
jgi:hypothetical protein